MKDNTEQGMRHVTNISFIVAMLFLALLLLGAGVYFYIIGDDIWNETLIEVKQLAGKGDGLILYDNLRYAHERMMVGTYMMCSGILSLLIAAYRGLYQPSHVK